MNIKDLEITREMYERALEVENAWKELKKAEETTDCINKDLEKLTKKWIRLDNAFQDEVNSDFDTEEIVREYERRKKGKNKITYYVVNEDSEIWSTGFNTREEAEKEMQEETQHKYGIDAKVIEVNEL